MMLHSLRARLMVLIGVSISALFIICALAISVLLERSLWSEFDSALQDRARSLGQLIEQEEHGFSFEWLEGVGLPAPITSGRESVAVWCDGDILAVLPPNATPIRSPGGELLSSGQRVFETLLDAGVPARAVDFHFAPRVVFEANEHQLRQLQQPRVSLIFARATADVESAIVALRWTIALVGLMGIIGTLAISWFAVGIGLSPIKSATRSIAALRAGTLNQRIEGVVFHPQELRPLMTTINRLLGRLEQTFERERSFAADVAHELRTPLAGLRAQLDLALARPRSSQEYAQTIRNCLEITTQTGAIVESLLETTKDMVMGRSSEAIPLRELVSGILDEFAALIQSRNLRIDNVVPEGLAVSADRQSLTIILRNLIENAVSHADVKSQVQLTAKQDEIGLSIVVSNQASSFPAGDIEKVFDRLWRADSSRHETGRHSGLGLSLCQRLAQRCGAALHASCANDVFRMELVLPARNR